MAVIGLGRMGAAMAQRFADAGFRLALWNRDSSKAVSVADSTGGETYRTAAEAARAAGFVISSLADDEAVRSVYLEPGGICEGAGPDTLVIDTSTIDPQTVTQVGAAVDRTGAGFIDCPVSGSVSTVLAGNLLIMAGGPEELVAQAEPVLKAIAQRVIHVGDRGTGAATKLAVNGLVHAIDVALSEALVLAEKSGVARQVAYEVFAGGAAGAPFVVYKREAFEHPESAPVAFSLDLMAKDLELITGLAERVGAPMEQARKGLEIVRSAIAAGLGERDMSVIAAYLRGDG